MPSPLKDVKVTDDKRQKRKANGGSEGAKKVIGRRAIG
jgi:hypothetical protein